ncbi:hypothetical protein ACJMK2_020512 [Sinanodonta woodiana]|uniref:TIR domain-containing protein n=1 Tax=Sinanodonta woodiana TaxID=1069815 RepID=A0ABD3U2Q7_SINWO
MSQRQGNGRKCVCTCSKSYGENKRSLVENSCKCHSCCQLNEQLDEETLPKEPDLSSDQEARENVGLSDRCLSDRTLYIHLLNQENRLQMSGSEHGYDVYRRSEMENSCICRSCRQLVVHSDTEETQIKQPLVSSADEDEARGNVSVIRRRTSGNTMNSYSQDNRPQTTWSNIFASPGPVSSGTDESFRGLRLFCTCSSDLRQAVKMVKNLKSSGFEVHTDRYRNNLNVSDTSIAGNIQDWLDGNIAHADFVIVCISPKYLEDIQPPSDDVPEADTRAFFTRYIYDQLRAEYYINRCRHQKIIPVRFSESHVPYTNIPPFMKTTIVYTYPKDHKDLVSFLNRRKVNL